jgi:hypothetical protein
MKMLNTTCRLESQRSLCEHYTKRLAAVTPQILCLGLLALLTGCNATLELKPDKAPGGTTGNRSGPVYLDQGPVYPPFYPDPVYQGPITQTDGGYPFVPVSNPASNPSGRRDSAGGPSFSIKITSAR